MRLSLGMVFLPFQEIRIPGMDVAFISCAMLRQGFRPLNLGMTFPYIRLPCGMVARAQCEARGLCAERPDKGRGRPRMRAAAPGAIARAIAQRKAIAARQSARAICPRNASVLSCRPEGGGAKRSRLPACHPLLDAWQDQTS